MGWASGYWLASALWADLKSLVPEDKQEEAADIIIKAFENNDCDDLDECPELIEAASKETRQRYGYEV
ncbi:MAG: hypothetical protein ACYS7Y_11830 [Planctomycetota bacterium]|jgi:hypothetical protein